MIKKIIACVLSAILVLSLAGTGFAANAPSVTYSYYGNGMLFEQNEEAIITGTTAPGGMVYLALYDSNGSEVAKGQCQADRSGNFAVSFMAPEGGYEQYTVILSDSNGEFKRINNVVFGELWISSGQSNMQYPLAQAAVGRDMFARGELLSEWLRVLLVPAIPAYKGAEGNCPLYPQTDIPGSKWVTGEDASVYNVSAVAYFFAAKLMEELDMPVGILNISLGGSSIESWLSRDAIDSDADVKNHLINKGRYIELSQWDEFGQSIYHDMTVNYNLKVQALKNFRVSGMVWYQGETDYMLGYNEDYYTKAFDLMQRTYTDVFEYEDGLLPIIYTQLASYGYDDTLGLVDWNINYTEMQKARPESRAVVTIYDLPLTFLPEVGAIHPETKKEIGERMAYCAGGLIYGNDNITSAPYVWGSEVADGSVYVKFKNTGDGLVSKGDTLYGFAVCSTDGIYVKANAEIVDRNTVKIWSDDVTSPVSASYAYSLTNGRANLFAGEKGEAILPVSQFVTDKSVGAHYWEDKIWAECDQEKIWHNDTDVTTGFYDTWTGKNADVSVSDNCVTAVKKDNKKNFSVMPNIFYKDGVILEPFTDVDVNYSYYGKVTFLLRNNGERDVTFKGMRFYKNDATWHSAAVDATGENSIVIPADGQWHTVTLNLNRLYLHGNEGGIIYSNKKLEEVSKIELCFSSPMAESSSVSVDNISFTPETGEEDPFSVSFENADNVFEYICALFVSFIGLIADIFR